MSQSHCARSYAAQPAMSLSTVLRGDPVTLKQIARTTERVCSAAFHETPRTPEAILTEGGGE
jgi:hypothetical protein